MTLPTSAFIFRNLVVEGFWLTEWIARNKKAGNGQAKRDMINEILELSRGWKFVAPDCLKISWSKEDDLISEMFDDKNKGKKIVLMNKE